MSVFMLVQSSKMYFIFIDTQCTPSNFWLGSVHCLNVRPASLCLHFLSALHRKTVDLQDIIMRLPILCPLPMCTKQTLTFLFCIYVCYTTKLNAGMNSYSSKTQLEYTYCIHIGMKLGSHKVLLTILLSPLANLCMCHLEGQISLQKDLSVSFKTLQVISR